MLKRSFFTTILNVFFLENSKFSFYNVNVLFISAGPEVFCFSSMLSADGIVILKVAPTGTEFKDLPDLLPKPWSGLCETIID